MKPDPMGYDQACPACGRFVKGEVRCEVNEKETREYLWINHGCPIGGLYGDDGEMQCNNGAVHKPIDFTRESLTEITRKLKQGKPTHSDCGPSAREGEKNG